MQKTNEDLPLFKWVNIEIRRARDIGIVSSARFAIVRGGKGGGGVVERYIYFLGARLKTTALNNINVWPMGKRCLHYNSI